MRIFCITALLAMAGCLLAGVGQASASPPDRPAYRGLAIAYAQAMIEHGRDTYGPEHSPLFAAALDRQTMRLGSKEAFGGLPGVRDGDRSLAGANPQHDMALYGLLYRLSEITGNRRYADEADNALRYFLTHAQSSRTGLLAWGEHLYYHFVTDGPAKGPRIHEICAEWPHWDVCFDLEPEASWRFAVGLWRHQVADHQTGDFSRHARFARHGPDDGADFPRYAGQMIATWSDALAHASSAQRPADQRMELRQAIEIMIRRMEQNRTHTKIGCTPAYRGADFAWPHINLELARCLGKSAPKVDAALGKQMRDLARLQDEDFLNAPHTIGQPGGAFVSTISTETGQPRQHKMNPPHTATWAVAYGKRMTAEIANWAIERYHQLADGQPETAERYRKLIEATAGIYLQAEVDREQALTPYSLANAIDLMLSMHALSGEQKYLQRADHFAREAVALFLVDDLPLPRATSRDDHYEAITGGPDLMLALLRLAEASESDPTDTFRRGENNDTGETPSRTAGESG